MSVLFFPEILHVYHSEAAGAQWCHSNLYIRAALTCVCTLKKIIRNKQKQHDNELIKLHYSVDLAPELVIRD